MTTGRRDDNRGRDKKSGVRDDNIRVWDDDSLNHISPQRNPCCSSSTTRNATRAAQVQHPVGAAGGGFGMGDQHQGCAVCSALVD